MKTLFLAVALALPLAAQITAIPAASGAGTGTVTSIATSCGVGGGTITTSGTVKGTELVNAQSGTSYAILTGDCGKVVVGANAAAQAYTIAQAGSAGFAAGFYFDLRSAGAGTITFTPTTSTINGATTLALTTGQSARIISDGTNYVALLGGGSSGGTGNKAVIDTPTTGASMTFAGGSSSAGTVDLVVPTAALSANVTSSTCSGFTVGQHVTFIFTQDATGGRTVASCAGWDAFVISPTASTATTLAFSIDASGNGHLEGASSNETPSILRMPSERAAPATPATGMTLFPDSTGHMPRWLYTSGTFFQGEVELSSGAIRAAGGADAVDTSATAAQMQTAIGMPNCAADGSHALTNPSGTMGCTAISGGGTTPLLAEYFLANSWHDAASGSPLGQLGWGVTGVNQLTGYASGSFPYVPGPGGIDIAGFTTNNNGTVLALAGYGFSGWTQNLSTATNWKYQFDFYADHNFSTGTIWRVGFADSSGGSELPNNGIWIRYNNNSVCTSTGTDTTWIAESRASSTSSTANTTVTATNNAIFSVIFQSSVSGTIQVSVSTNGGAYSTPVNLTTNLPTTQLAPFFAVWRCGTDVHMFPFRWYKWQ